MIILVAYSGGKDSQASLIWAVKKYGAKNIIAVFCDTVWENPVTYAHITNTCKDLGVKLVTVMSKKYDGMEDMAIKKGRFASSKMRFCTAELKTTPMIDYVLDRKDLIIIQGIRGDESASRSEMSKQCSFFKYYFEPYKSNQIIIEQDQRKGIRIYNKAGNEKQKNEFGHLELSNIVNSMMGLLCYIGIDDDDYICLYIF